ncbi:MAG TPA: UDP-N-acetylmuramoyl-L-alanine--D-glutamate ligase, partial [Chthoniobacterales bacterium]|nr:UDP-N-acetylmuramoyl-L-alanine--D-glutamate ligase [Chthoniobacterales bacterium]
MKYQGKNVAVLGAGLSGTAAALLLRSEGADVTVLDSAEEKTLLKSTIENLRARGVAVRCGQEAETDSSNYDFVVLSPGIDPISPLATNFSSRKIETMGELELGWRSVDLPVIAITGTNGKTTTTELLAQMLNGCGQSTIACGNIGKPLCEVALEDRDLDVLTVEVSSFQLETIRTFRPSISVWLNFAPDHLDRYPSVAEYRAAKLRIFENQTADDVAVVNAGETLPKIAARTVTFSAYTDQADFRLEGGSIVYQNTPVLRMAETKLRGSHNIENLMATLAVGLARGLSFEEMLPPLCAYEPRPHRCEFVRELGEVTYVNDSKATNLAAVEKALLAQNKSVILIAGGKDKGFTFETLLPLVSEKVRTTILIGEMAERIARDWKSGVPCEI